MYVLKRISNFKADSIKYAEWMLIPTLQVCSILLFPLYFWKPSVKDNDRYSTDVCTILFNTSALIIIGNFYFSFSYTRKVDPECGAVLTEQLFDVTLSKIYSFLRFCAMYFHTCAYDSC